jgi:molybdopterin synthase sulfur carrier subunit
MSKRRVKLFATLREIAGAKDLQVSLENGASVREMIAAVGKLCPALESEILDEAGNLSGQVNIIVRGRNVVWLQGLDTAIRDEDELALVPIVGGGSREITLTALGSSGRNGGVGVPQNRRILALPAGRRSKL